MYSWFDNKIFFWIILSFVKTEKIQIIDSIRVFWGKKWSHHKYESKIISFFDDK